MYAIAEIGLNHGGSPARALRMVDAAAQAGVTAIKLQSIVAERLVAPGARLGHVGAASLVDFFRALELDWDAHRAVIARAHERRLLALTTPFAVDVVPTLDAMGFDLTDARLVGFGDDGLTRDVHGESLGLLFCYSFLTTAGPARAGFCGLRVGRLEVSVKSIARGPVRAGQDDGVPIQVADPKFPVVRAAVPIRRVAVPGENHLRPEFRRAGDSRVEVVDLEPEQDAVPVRPVGRVADRPVVVVDPEPVQLQDQRLARNEPFVLRPAVCARATEQPLIPPATRFDIGDGEEGLGPHRGLRG